jgi:hypothetical protein
VSGQQIKCDVIEVSLAPIGTAGRDRDGHWAGDTGRMLGHESQLLPGIVALALSA